MWPRTFSGRECWVYRAQAPGELCGHHPELIQQALCGAEPDYLVYSPRREPGRGPFGLNGPGGSHAVALTRTSLIVSRDPHRPGRRRTVRRIPLPGVLMLAIGEALTLGWLAVDFVEDRAAATEIVFFPSSGIAHFREIVRRWLAREAPGSSPAGACGGCAERLAGSPAYLAGQAGPLIADWRAAEVVNVPEAWEGEGARACCVSASTLLVLTDSVVLLAESERPPRPGTLVFGVNVFCLLRRTIAEAALKPPDDPERSAVELTLTLAAGDVRRQLRRELAMTIDVARCVLARLGSRGPRAEGAK
jgi:hypothetical protein